MDTPHRSQSAPEAVGRILAWYRHNGRPLPWRRTRLPYRILLSEVMLQQTQASRVEQKYRHFLRQFPTLSALARAEQRDVVIAWRGLGYNNRAVRLHALARHVHTRCSGRIPRTVSTLVLLPGVGRYTAHAVAAFAFGMQIPVVDVNVRRVISRIFRPMTTMRAVVNEPAAWAIAREVLPAGRAYDWNQALMDFGALVCTAAQPRCSRCPVSDVCASRALIHRPRRNNGSAWLVGRQGHRVSPGASAPRRERLHRGTPLRVYRGRVVEALRNAHPRRTVAASTLGRSTFPPFTGEDRRVFHQILCALERDGLVRVRRNRESIPERVSLA